MAQGSEHRNIALEAVSGAKTHTTQETIIRKQVIHTVAKTKGPCCPCDEWRQHYALQLWCLCIPFHFVHAGDVCTQRIDKYFVLSSFTVHTLTKGECLGRYANDKYPDNWILVKNENLEPTVNSTAPDPPDGNMVPQMIETRGNTARVTHPTSMIRTWPWPHEHKHYDT